MHSTALLDVKDCTAFDVHRRCLEFQIRCAANMFIAHSTVQRWVQRYGTKIYFVESA